MAVSELELRRRAVELHVQGWGATAIGDELGRSREWVRKWVGRWNAEGDDGLVDRSKRPHHSPSQLDETVVAEIVAVRDSLDDDPHANVGAVAVQAEMERIGAVDPPSLSSIKRVLAAAGRTRSYRLEQRSGGNKWQLPSPIVPGVWQQSDWIHDRRVDCGTVFSSLQITDVGSHGLSAEQHQRRTLLVAVRQLTRQAWPRLSIPLAMGQDNAFARTSHRDNPWTIWTLVLLMFGVEAITSPPHSLGFTNHVESVNGLWQQRTIRKHWYPDLETLRADNTVFLDWANHRRPVLDPTVYGTRYPAELIAAHHASLRWLPTGFDIDDYLDATNHTRLPLTAGRVTFLRHVTSSHIVIAQHPWPVPESLPAGSLVVAAINTATAHLEIRHKGELVQRHDYPVTPSTIEPLHPPPSHGLLDHLPGPLPTMS